jgi:hypothetical protein
VRGTGCASSARCARESRRAAPGLGYRARTLAFVLGALALAGCTTAPPEPFAGPATETVYVIGRGWHTDVGLAVDALGPPLSSLAARYPGARVLSFGFGDREYMLAHGGSIAGALGALFPGPALVLLTVLNTSPIAAFGEQHVVALPVTRAGFDRIARFVWDSLATQSGRLPEPYAPGPYAGSIFFASTVTYNAFETCNTWAAQALRKGGLPISGGPIFASQVMQEARAARERLLR